MFFSGDNTVLKLINAEALNWQAGFFDVKPRKVCALAFRVEGSADMFCAGKRLFIDAGDILYMPQGLGYQVNYTDTRMFVFHFVTQKDDSEPEVYRLHNRSQLHPLFMRAAELWAQKEPGYVHYCTALLYQILGDLAAQNMADEMPANFRKAISYIHRYFNKPISADEICAHASISPTAFRQCFQQYYEQTPTEYIRTLRLEYARNLIAGGMGIREASEACGIPDPKYFARLVSKKYACTPRQLKDHGK